MAQEIERKFLLRELPDDLEEHVKHEIVQGYVAVTTDGIEVRVRRKGEKYFLTVKSGEGARREEEEFEIDKTEFDKLWPFTNGKRIEKTRYEIPHRNHLIELDVYSGSLAGLRVAEVEFESEEDSTKFKAPPWLGREITEDERYKNKNLALMGIPV
jgi:adenylate cyclase